MDTYSSPFARLYIQPCTQVLCYELNVHPQDFPSQGKALSFRPFSPSLFSLSLSTSLFSLLSAPLLKVCTWQPVSNVTSVKYYSSYSALIRDNYLNHLYRGKELIGSDERQVSEWKMIYWTNLPSDLSKLCACLSVSVFDSFSPHHKWKF